MSRVSHYGYSLNGAGIVDPIGAKKKATTIFGYAYDLISRSMQPILLIRWESMPLIPKAATSLW